MSELYHSLINESSLSSTVSLSNNKYLIFIGPKCNKENDYLLETNKISSSKYSFYDFFPKILMEQFSYISNIYFLIISILQTIKVISYSNGTPIMLIPFSFVVLINGVKDLYEDIKRRKMNNLDNNRICEVYDLKKNKFVNKKWEDIKLGDIIKIYKNEIICCDMILLETSESNGICLVEPKNINGESNLYMKQINTNWKKSFVDYSDMNYICIANNQNDNLYKFKGTLYEIEYDGSKEIKLTQNKNEFYFNQKNFLLRGMILRQTDYIIGCAIYVGHNTKVMINSPKLKNKQSKLEKKMNKLVIVIFVFQLCLSMISSIINIFQDKDKFLFINKFIYDSRNNKEDAYKEIFKFLKTFGTWIVMMTNFVPISLLTTFPFSKLCYGYFISKDIDMTNKLNMIGTKVHSSNLNEELGQINFIFTDKTGTLTQNRMKFKAFSIGTSSYGEEDTNTNNINSLFNKINKDKYGDISDIEFNDKEHKLKDILNNNKNNKTLPKNILHFFYNLCLCNDVEIDYKKLEKNSIIEYISSSSDEKCLINFSRYCGFIYKNKINDNTIIIEKNINNHYTEDIKFIKCHILEFTSERRRMSVIIKNENEINNNINTNNKYYLYIKGSDNAITKLISEENKSSKEYKYIMQKTFEYSQKGLRTLLIGYKELTSDEFIEFENKYKYLSEDLDENNTQDKIYKLYEDIETNIILLGVTAIEDKLQYKADETINKFINIGIKICMVTGDKLETAKNIAKSCKLINQNMDMILVEYNKMLDIYNQNNQLENYLKNLLLTKFNNNNNNSNNNKKYCLLINGDTLSNIFESEKAIKLFTELFQKSDSIICSRLDPQQKAKLVSIIKTYTKKVCLAIGDGANDVGMITEANIGIGIHGLEGTEASRASDYSINQFFNLEKLILYHGRESYRKNSYYIIYNFYKNIIFVAPMFFFGFFNFFSGITLYEPFLHQLYNVIYSIFPIFYFSIFDREFDSDILLQNNKYYIQGIKDECFNIFIFYKYLILGFIEGFILFASAFSIFYFNNYEGYNLNDLYSIGNTILSGVIIIVNLKVLFNAKIIDLYLIFLIIISIMSFYFGVILFSGEKIGFISIPKTFSSYYILGDYTYIFKDKKYLLYILFIIGEILILNKILNSLFDYYGKKKDNNDDNKNDLKNNNNEIEMDFISNSELNELEKNII